MNIENIAMGALSVLEQLGKAQKELAETKTTSENYRDWWTRANKELSEIKETQAKLDKTA